MDWIRDVFGESWRKLEKEELVVHWGDGGEREAGPLMSCLKQVDRCTCQFLMS